MWPWLNDLTRWDWFGTYTFSEQVSAAAAHYWFDRYIKKAENALNSWAEPLSKPSNAWGYVCPQMSFPRSRIQAFRVDEYGPRRGRLHIHALLGNTQGIKRWCGQNLPPGQWGKSCCFVHAWQCGYARVLEYDPKLGARYYVSKYITKAFGDWQLYGFGK